MVVHLTNHPKVEGSSLSLGEKIAGKNNEYECIGLNNTDIEGENEIVIGLSVWLQLTVTIE